MAMLVAVPRRLEADLVANLRDLDPDLDLRTPDAPGDVADITFALVWKQPPGLLARLPALAAVTSMGAGVDAILADPDLPDDLPVGRLAGPRLAANMAAYLVAMVVNRWKGLPDFAAAQRRREWRQWAPEKPPAIGLLGTGAMGGAAAAAFRTLDFPVAGYSRSGHGPDGVQMYSGADGLHTIAGQSDVLVCLLPLTDATRELLDARLFAAMKPGAELINVGRGEHLVESDLLEALDRGRPGHAILDVFREEPLPPDHPFWDHPEITITPHCSSITLPREAAELALESYRRVRSGGEPLGRVERSAGY